jgi:hypothetical protein
MKWLAKDAAYAELGIMQSILSPASRRKRYERDETVRGVVPLAVELG